MRLKIFSAVSLTLLFIFFSGFQVFASPYVYYEKVIQEELVRGVYYTSYRQVTNQGLRDIYILKVPTKDPYIKLKPADSALDFGFKQTVKTMLSDSNAIAGINGDFFGLAGSYSNPFGPVIRDGVIRSLNTFLNYDENNYASFFLEDDGNPFILYLRSEIIFLNNGAQHIEVAAKNKITDLTFPVYFDRNAMVNTEALDVSFPGLYKVVVDNGVIIQVSDCGENVTIPENGYIIAMSQKVAEQSLYNYAPGQSAEIIIRGGVDYDKIETAIGGAGRILLDGEPVSDTGYVAPKMHPRSAIGISEDKSYVILMVVDGRTHSIGASQEDMSNLMKRFGAYNAMHLDGGGSSTMVVKNEDLHELEVVNTPSDGGERKVINALGVYDYAPVGEAVDFKLEASHTRVFKNTPVEIKAYKVDAYLHKTQIPGDQITITASDSTGYWFGEYFYPGVTGDIHFYASYGSTASSITVQSVDIGALYPSQSGIKVGLGGSAGLSFTGVSNNGYSAYIYNSGVNVTVYPQELGYMQNGLFVAASPGAGYLECSVGSVKAYVDVTVGAFPATITSFEDLPRISFASAPDTVEGHSALTSEHTTDGFIEARLKYYFGLNQEGTQTAQLVFDEPLTFGSNLLSISMNVYGDNSGHRLMAQFMDAEESPINVELAEGIDWEGYEEVTGVIPADASYPLTLKSIYVVSFANNEEDTHYLYFDKLTGMFEQKFDPIPHPDPTPYADILSADLSGPPAEGSFDIVISGGMLGTGFFRTPAGYDNAIASVLNGMTTNSRLAVYAGETNAPLDIGVDLIKWNKNFYMHSYESVNIVQMSAQRGGLLSTDTSQWLDFLTQIQERGLKNIIITMDTGPLKFKQQKEFELFHEMLKDIRDSGKNIIVVSTSGTKTSFDVIEGIRYINLGGLWDSGNNINPEFRLLRLRVSPTDITYQFQNIGY